MPNSVRIAVNLMFTGMGVGGIIVVVGLRLGAVKAQMRTLGYSDATVNADTGAYTAVIVITGLIGLISPGLWLWLWTALATRAGHN